MPQPNHSMRGAVSIADTEQQNASLKHASPSNQFGDLAGVLPACPPATIEQWLRDDCPTFDVGGYVVGNKQEEAWLWCKSPGVLAGVPFFNAVFEYVGCKVEWKYEEGVLIDVGKSGKVVAARVFGPARNLLLGERTALNILARASGIATQARRMRKIKEAHGWHGEIAATRKVTPGFRLVEKYAALVGGVSTHRMDLSHMVMLKDNHIWSSGGIAPAVHKARSACGFSSKIEVECRSFEEAVEAAEAGAEICMLDNMQPHELKECAARLKCIFPKLIIEASGGITEETAADYFSADVDVLSQGALTQGYGFIDFSLKIQSNYTQAKL